ncbi:MAG: hypothetical protein AAGJ87_04260, partial [Pseudomonadota bacterium]
MRKTIFSLLTATSAISAVAATQAAAQTITCTRGDDVRLLEVLTPGAVGKACDLRYTTNNGATVRTPYHANNNAGYCAEQSKTILAELSGSGYACVSGATAAVDAAASVASSQRAAIAPPSAPPPTASAEAERTPAPTFVDSFPASSSAPTPKLTNEPAAPEPIASAEAPAETAQQAVASAQRLEQPATPSADRLRDSLAEILTDDAETGDAPTPSQGAPSQVASPQTAASSGPVALTTAASVVEE